MRVFTPADILLPRVDDMTKWSCIACDQFTAEPEYWREAERIVGSEPSTLRLMLPEAWLGVRDSAAETRKIYAAMKDYVNRGIFRTVEDSFVYVERTLPSGAVRRGLVGKLDLECYDWAPGSATPVRAPEGTVERRLPARVEVRRGATLEMPHIMVFIDDPENAVIPSAAGGEALYDFELMLGGGHIRGSRVTGEAAERLTAALEAPEGSVRFAMGDGSVRFLIEFVRVPDAQLGYLLGGVITTGQLLSLPLVVAGAVLIVYAQRKARPQCDYLEK